MTTSHSPFRCTASRGIARTIFNITASIEKLVLSQHILHGSLHTFLSLILLDSKPDNLEPVSPKKEISLNKKTNKFGSNDAENGESEPSTNFERMIYPIPGGSGAKLTKRSDI